MTLIPLLTHLENEYEKGNCESVYIGVDKSLSSIITEYIRNRFNDATDCYKRLEKRMNELTHQYKRDITSEEAKICHEIANEYQYDKRFIGEGVLNWRMRSREELEKNKLLVCHESAWLTQQRVGGRIIMCRTNAPIIYPGSNHSIVIKERNNKTLLIDSAYGDEYGVFEFDDLNAALNSLSNHHFVKYYDITDIIKEGMTVSDLEKHGKLIKEVRHKNKKHLCIYDTL